MVRARGGCVRWKEHDIKLIGWTRCYAGFGEMPILGPRSCLCRRLKHCALVLEESRRRLVQFSNNRLPISPAAKWFLDNQCMIREQIQAGRGGNYEEGMTNIFRGSAAPLGAPCRGCTIWLMIW